MSLVECLWNNALYYFVLAQGSVAGCAHSDLAVLHSLPAARGCELSDRSADPPVAGPTRHTDCQEGQVLLLPPTPAAGITGDVYVSLLLLFSFKRRTDMLSSLKEEKIHVLNTFS